ncbi:bifunctional hydroxymethylpyrimidine kinase/phosphomethylpyrimidine kinase [Fodinicurvata halophila]|uniref:Bifunctional hydroxymethylpyrimidine kinase/phosphomethylpyrimidine kinase n=1 Tax=Fodinicurvata halophila TaxID=1419723 RepID=A0ABV8UKE2_9PROT
MNTKGRILLIGRSDCLGEKGVQAGIWTAGVHGLAASTIVMNMTARDEGLNFEEIELSGTFIVRQAETILQKQNIDVVKVGRLSSEEQIEATARILEDSRLNCPVVISPAVFRSNDSQALGVRALAHWKRRLPHLATMIVATEREADALGGFHAEGREELPHVAETLATLGSESVLLSALLPGQARGVDIFLDASGQLHEREFPLIREGEYGLDTPNLSTALACQLALGCNLMQAAGLARDFVAEGQGWTSELPAFAEVQGG